MVNGQRVIPAPSPSDTVTVAQQRFASDLAALPEDVRRIRQPLTLMPQTSARLAGAIDELRQVLTGDMTRPAG